MPTIQAIPCPPGEDYDHTHSTIASLSSLNAMVASFDAIMDSLEKTTEKYSRRVDNLTKRCEESREKIEKMKRLGEKGVAVTIRAPASYPVSRMRAFGTGKESSSTKVKHKEQNQQYSHRNRNTPLDSARKASNEAVKHSLNADWKKDDCLAYPSDLWLDRASGFDEGNSCRSADRVHTIPSLLYNMKIEEMEKISEKMDEVEGRRKNPTDDSSTSQLISKENDDEARDVFEQFQNSTFSSAQSPWNTNTNDGNLMDLEDDEAHSMITSSTIFTTKQTHSKYVKHRSHQSKYFKVQDELAPNPRLNASTGSEPFLCELLHDSYGVGLEPPRGDPGSYYAAPATVNELFFFNTDQECYKKANAMSEEDIESLEEFASSWEYSSVPKKNTVSSSNAVENVSDNEAASPLNVQHSDETKVKSANNPNLDNEETSPQNDSKIAQNIESFYPRDSKFNINPLELPDNLPLESVASIKVSSKN